MISWHGYARWQPMVENKDIGLADIVRQELNLPFINGSFTEGVQMNDGASCSHSANGSSETTKGSQSHPDSFAPCQIRELQRRMVDFIRKRYLLLEKALDAEYCLIQAGFLKPGRTESQNPETEPKGPETSNSNPLGTNSLLKELPILEPIAPEEPAYDNQPERLDMARLYNNMCIVVEENALNSVQAYSGDHFAGSRLSKSLYQIETICADVDRILTGKNQNSAAAAERSDVNMNPYIVQTEVQKSVGGDGILPSSSQDDVRTGTTAESSTQVHASETNRDVSNSSTEHCEDKSG